MKNILVTGGDGFIGSHLIKQLGVLGNEVFNMDIKDGLDINSKVFERGRDIDKDDPYDVIFHLAAYVSASKSIEEPHKCYETNITGLLNVLDIPHKKFVFASSAAVYGDRHDQVGPNIMEWDDEFMDNLLTPYAKSKLIGETLVEELSPNHSILRFFNVYGENQNPEYGAVIQSFIDCYKQNKHLTIYGDGEQTRDFIHVDDVVDALILASEIENPSTTFNVGSGIGTTVNELAHLIAKPLENIIYREARKGDPIYSVANNENLKSYGWSAKVSLEEGIKQLKK